MGSVVALVDFDTKKICESYTYSTFGEEEIYNSQNEVITASATRNPWRYRSLRKEDVTGFILMGIAASKLLQVIKGE